MKIKTLSVWACTGANVSELSFALARKIAEENKTLICELPCLGLPRLGFVSEHMDRIRNTEAAILALDRQEDRSWQLVTEDKPSLWVLPVSVYAMPDCPVTARVSVETLIHFTGALKRLAGENGVERLIFDCQGQLHSPMTFFALRSSEQILIPVENPADLAYVLASLRRLVKNYGYQPEQFLLAVDGETRPVEKLLRGTGRRRGELLGVKVLPREIRKLAGGVDWSISRERPGEDRLADFCLVGKARGEKEEADRAAPDNPAADSHSRPGETEGFLSEPEETGPARAVAGCSIRL